MRESIFFSKYLYITVFVLQLLGSCKTTDYGNIVSRNFASKYNPGSKQLHLESSIFKQSDEEIKLYYRFFPREFMYSALNKDSIPMANVSLFYKITDGYESYKVIDSLTTNFILKGAPHYHYVGYLPIKIREKGSYVIEVSLIDNNTYQTTTTVLDYNTSTGSNNDFMFLSDYGNPLFHSYFSINDKFRVRVNSGSKKVFLSYYSSVTKVPLSPDNEKKIISDIKQPDSTMVISNIDTVLFTSKKECIYYFTKEDNVIGKSFACFNRYFPYVKTSLDMLKPLEYLCDKIEMRELKSYKNPKEAVDTFWLQSANDVDIARELIRVYYNRVQLANYYFSDFREGSLTDRGMIYIVCGAPNTIKETEEGEYWIYGKTKKDITSFVFYKEKHPLFGTIYNLYRSEIYSNMWFNAIATWREGEVFSLDQ